MEKWSLADRHQFRLALENVPHFPAGKLLVDRSTTGRAVYSPADGRAIEVAFRSFALQRGLLSAEFFRRPAVGTGLAAIRFT
jgi:hypothetical protein